MAADEDTPETVAAALARAVSAAEAGDPVGMLESLVASPVLDGVYRWLPRKWGFLYDDEQAVTDLVADAIDDLYAAIRKGRHVGNVVSWLMKVADRKAFDLHRRCAREVPHDPTVLDGRAKENSDEQADLGELRSRALAIARSFLPRLGQDNLQRVMGMILDAVEAGYEDISNKEIAEALGLQANTVAKLKQRGFARLQRAAEEAGVESGLEVSHLGHEEDDEAGITEA